jgi:methylated-DNA-[protein]-cysteine S-methyltransferase
MTLAYKTIDSPVGKLKLVASDEGLVAVLWAKEKPNRVSLGQVEKRETHPFLIKAKRQIGEYFARNRRSFTLPFDMQGTSFQKQVWNALLAIPFGETASYGELAKRLGRPHAARAVGTASGKNPLAIIVPCHRVVGSTGKLTGFAGGLDAKTLLLELEGRTKRRGAQKSTSKSGR